MTEELEIKSEKDTKKAKNPRRGRNEGMIRWIESKKLWEARYPIGTIEYIGKDGKPRCKTDYKIYA